MHLPIHDVELLLQRHLRKARTARPDHRTERRPRRSANPRGVTAADRTAERSSERRGQNRGPHRLVGRGIGLRRGLRCGVLLTERLVGGKSFEILVRTPGRPGSLVPSAASRTRPEKPQSPECQPFAGGTIRVICFPALSEKPSRDLSYASCTVPEAQPSALSAPALDQIRNRLAQCVTGYPSDLLNLQVEIQEGGPTAGFATMRTQPKLDDGGNGVDAPTCASFSPRNQRRG